KGKSSDIGARSVKADNLPGLFVGGVRADGHPGFRLPGKKNPYFVIEGDEYDTAFFDKASKFLHYRPHHLILTSVEFDHADIFESLEYYKKAFRILLRWIPANGSLIPCLADAGVRDVVKGYNFSALFGYGKKGASSARRRGRAVSFELRNADGSADLSFSCEPSLIGEHNTLNAVAACLVARRLGISEAQLVRGLEEFPGVLRRQQIRARAYVAKESDESSDSKGSGGSAPGSRSRSAHAGPVTVAAAPRIFMEDFAHHPTAVEKTLAAVRQAYPGYRIIALYEPRSATSHRDIFAQEYVRGLKCADLVLLPDVFNRNKVPSSHRLDVKGIVEGLQKSGTAALYCKNPQGVLQALKKELSGSGGVARSRAREGTKKSGGSRGNSGPEQPVLVLSMSNGGFGGIYPEIDALIQGLRD
ncbi:MAG: hypothetical protein KDK23_08410, partial [Leptospiraceae bacterium]|nr:hypothetical protein [Leptospiraceae bacterium]